MAINPSTLPGYNGQTAAPDANYTYGSARDDAAPGDLTGTPRIAAELNDIFGFLQILLNKTSIVPSGNPDTVLISQYYDALEQFIKSSDFIDFVGRFDVGDRGTATNSSDPVVNVNRNVDGTGTNGHCFSDSSLVNRAGNVSYAPFDARYTVEGTDGYGHFANYQSAPIFKTTGTIGINYGFIDIPASENGTITDRYGAFIADIALSGPAIVTHNRGILIKELQAGTTTNLAIETEGLTKSKFNGEILAEAGITAAAKITAPTAQINGNFVVDQTTTSQAYTSLIGGGWNIDGVASTGMRIEAGVGSSTDFAMLTNGNAAFIMQVPTTTNNMQFEGNVGFNGTAPLAPPVLPAAATDLATVITLANSTRQLLIDYGLAT